MRFLRRVGAIIDALEDFWILGALVLCAVLVITAIVH